MKAEDLYSTIDEIRRLIDQHTGQTGELGFDGLRIQVALEFTKRELLNSISKTQTKETGE